MVDVAAVGDVLDTFPVCASPISCITSVPEFDASDEEIQAGMCVFCVCWVEQAAVDIVLITCGKIFSGLLVSLALRLCCGYNPEYIMARLD